ncbi:unnamed protein product [Ilex paraguariensis]|uniref:Uncharacterized protein n=1 Tax=Ilex paraguariensis TaxID=185542 RepID=A0ABC8SQN4_9AQUA
MVNGLMLMVNAGTAIGMFSDAADLGTQSAPPIMDIRRGHISEAESEPLRAGRPCWAQVPDSKSLSHGFLWR